MTDPIDGAGTAAERLARLDLSESGIREAFRDAVGFARAASHRDIDGSWVIWRAMTGDEQMRLCLNLANLLNWALCDDDGEWADMLAMVEEARG